MADANTLLSTYRGVHPLRRRVKARTGIGKNGRDFARLFAEGGIPPELAGDVNLSGLIEQAALWEGKP